jgi:hypothetical protein
MAMTVRSLPATPAALRSGRSVRVRLADGAATTVHVACHDPRETDIRIVRLHRPAPLAAFCAEHGLTDALVGGFYRRPDLLPLGELRTRGILRRHEPFTAPYGAVRAALHVSAAGVAIAPRDALPAAPPGDLLQAGPMLVRGGRSVTGDAEGFSAASHQFDSDIMAGRHPRAAIGLTAAGALLAVACDGRADDEAGLTMGELATALLDLGAVDAMNLDGGGSTSLVCHGVLRNTPRESHGVALPGGREVSTAIVFSRR